MGVHFSTALLGLKLGGCCLRREALTRVQGYGQMTHRLMRFAGGRLVAALEGGYNIRATAECAAETVRVLLEGLPRDVPGWPHSLGC